MKRMVMTAFMVSGAAVSFAWDLDQVDVVDIDPLDVICSEWKPAPVAKRQKVLWFSECFGYNHHGGRCYGDYTFKAAGERSGAWEVVQVKDVKKLADAEFLKGFGAIVFCNSSGLEAGMAPGMETALADFVKAGGGIALIHAGLDAFRDSDALLDLFGGYFRGHPWHGDGTWRFLNERPANPINASFRNEPASFPKIDEIYQFPAFYDRGKCEVLISMDVSDPVTKAAELWWAGRFGKGSTRADHDYAVSWTKTEGKGRVFYTSFGHDRQAFLDRERLYHMFAGLQYVLGDLPVKGELVHAADAAMQRTDWANGPWKEKLDARVRDARGKVHDIVLLGDSITMGWTYSKTDKWSGGKEVWESSFGSLVTMNLGMSGDRTEHLLWRVADGGQADGWTAKTILVMIGINNACQKRPDGSGPDTPAAAAKGTRRIVEILKEKHPESRIVLVGCLPVSSLKAGNAWVRDYNAILATFADGRRVVFRDFGPRYLKSDGTVDGSLFSDGLHPNPAGYARAAAEIGKLMKESD